MCVDPTIGIAIGTALMGTLSAVGTYQSQTNQAKMQEKLAQSQAARLDYEAKLNDRNASIIDIQQEQLQEQAKHEKISLSNRIALLRGEGRASFAASGVVLGTGSPFDWEIGVDEAERYDRDIIDYNTAWDAWSLSNKATGYRVQAGMLRSQAESTREFGKATSRSAKRGAQVGLLAGVGSAVVGGFGAYTKLGGTFSTSAVTGVTAPKIKVGFFGPGY